MTGLAPEIIEPEKRDDTLWVTDAELIRRSGVPEKVAREALRMLDSQPTRGFPQKKALWGNRRYWPAVQAWFDRDNGLKSDVSTPIRRAS